MKKGFATLLALCMALGLFAGCSNQQATTTTTAEPTDPGLEVNMLPKDKTYSILFIGNSYTEYNRMYKTYFEPFAESCGYDVEVTAITQGGYKLEQFADPEDTRGAIVAQTLDGTQKFDYVILQEQSVLPATDSGAFYDAVRKLAGMARAIGAQPVLYATWGRKSGSYDLVKYNMTNESMTWKLAAAYSAIGKELDIPVVYVGLAFYDLHNNTGVEIYDGDATHPSSTGSCVVALTLFSSIFGVDPTTVTLPDYISEWDIYQIKEAVKKAVFDTPEIPAEYQTTSEGVTEQEN